LLKFSGDWVTVEIYGGLGNQLFMLVAGLYISNKIGCRLRVIQRDPHLGDSVHGSSINSLITGVEVEPKILLREDLALTSKKLVFAFSRRLNIPLSKAGLILGFHSSNSLGFDKTLSNVRRGYHIEGYFQTFRYLQDLRASGKAPLFTLKQPSDWFLKTSDQLVKTDPIVMHVRRGDYLLEKNRFIGALSSEYFLDAINKLTTLGSRSTYDKVWIFTDSPDSVALEFQPILGSRMKLISPPVGSDPAESMSLMSMAKSIVISNSTFSWWSASLGNPTQVIAPSKWFQDHDDPEDLLPKDWLKAESKWI